MHVNQVKLTKSVSSSFSIISNRDVLYRDRCARQMTFMTVSCHSPAQLA
jgi:hypothetical protein